MFALSVSVTVMPVSTRRGTFSVWAVVPPLAVRTGRELGLVSETLLKVEVLKQASVSDDAARPT